MLYGRAGEEILYFRERGFEALTIPGVSSALAAPLLANIPVTQRGVSESLIVCTGVGRKGRDVQLPGYERSRTLVVLMGVARLPQMLEALIGDNEGDKDGEKRRSGAKYPPYTPIALIERASMPDQRVVASTLQHITTAIESTGEQRPPGLLVVGWAVLALWGEGDMTVLDGNGDASATKAGISVEDDLKRVERWLEGRSWRVKDGLDPSWNLFKAPVAEV
jgi:uroporphyrin-III C-methyltransferase